MHETLAAVEAALADNDLQAAQYELKGTASARNTALRKYIGAGRADRVAQMMRLGTRVRWPEVELALGLGGAVAEPVARALFDGSEGGSEGLVMRLGIEACLATAPSNIHKSTHVPLTEVEVAARFAQARPFARTPAVVDCFLQALVRADRDCAEMLLPEGLPEGGETPTVCRSPEPRRLIAERVAEARSQAGSRGGRHEAQARRDARAAERRRRDRLITAMEKTQMEARKAAARQQAAEAKACSADPACAARREAEWAQARAAEAAAKRQARIDEIDAQIAELQPLADGPDRRVVSSGYVQETRCVSADPVSGACRTTATGPVRQTKTVGNAYKSEAQAEIQKLQAERARLLAAP